MSSDNELDIADLLETAREEDMAEETAPQTRPSSKRRGKPCEQDVFQIDNFQRVAETIEYLESATETLKVLQQTLENFACFDDEDKTWVQQEIERLEQKQQKNKHRIQELLVHSQDLEAKRELLHQRFQVLSDIDNSCGCLRRNKRLMNKFVAKQKRLQDEFDTLTAELAKLQEPD